MALTGCTAYAKDEVGGALRGLFSIDRALSRWVLRMRGVVHGVFPVRILLRVLSCPSGAGRLEIDGTYHYAWGWANESCP